MDALLEYLKIAFIPSTERANVSHIPVRSVTLGMVNLRQHGYGISAATTLGKLRLLKLLVDVARDPNIEGGPPDAFTSICLNIDFASALHTDSHNAGRSWIVAVGEHEGGKLFVEKEKTESLEEEYAMEQGGAKYSESRRQ